MDQRLKPSNRIAEFFWLSAADATAKRISDADRKQLHRALAVGRQRAEAAEALWSNGHAAEGLRLAGQAFEATLETVLPYGAALEGRAAPPAPATPAQDAPAVVASAEVAPAEVAAAEVASAEVAPAGVASAEVASAQSTSADSAAEDAAADDAPGQGPAAEDAAAEDAAADASATGDAAPADAAPADAAPADADSAASEAAVAKAAVAKEATPEDAAAEADAKDAAPALTATADADDPASGDPAPEAASEASPGAATSGALSEPSASGAADAPASEAAASAAAGDEITRVREVLGWRGLSQSRLDDVVEVQKTLRATAVPDWDEDVTPKHGELFQRLVSVQRHLDNAMAPGLLSTREIAWSRISRVGGVVVLLLAACIGSYLGLRTPPGVNVTASGQWSADYGQPEWAIDGNPNTEWQTPNNQPGWLEITINPPVRVERLRVLNGHNRHYNDRGMRQATIEIYSDGEVAQTIDETWDAIATTPEWNEYDVGLDTVDKIRVEVHSFHRFGAALAELSWE